MSDSGHCTTLKWWTALTTRTIPTTIHLLQCKLLPDRRLVFDKKLCVLKLFKSCLLFFSFIYQGCQEQLDHFGEPKPWSAFRLSDYGYTRLAIHNATHLGIEQISDDQQGKVMDAITVVQEKHGPRKWIPLRSSPVSKFGNKKSKVF